MTAVAAVSSYWPGHIGWLLCGLIIECEISTVPCTVVASWLSCSP